MKGLTSIGLSPKATILTMIVIPVIMVFSYLALPSIPFAKMKSYLDIDENKASESDLDQLDNDKRENHTQKIAAGEKFFLKLDLMRPLVKYMIPLFIVYFAEYFINQGLFELLYFKDAFIKEHKLQYR